MSEPATCPHCGGGQIASGVKLGQSTEAGSVGLEYQGKLLFTGTEPLLADLCGGCGTVLRLFVANPDRRWLRAKP